MTARRAKPPADPAARRPGAGAAATPEAPAAGAPAAATPDADTLHDRQTEMAAVLAAVVGADLIEQRTETDGALRARVGAAVWRVAAETLANAGFARLEFLTCVDWDDHFSLTLQVYEMASRAVVRLVTDIPRDGLDMPTVSDLWPTAGWEERETFDQVGVVFTGHPDLRRILNPQNWEGHPLRRDYVDHVDITRPQYF